MGLSLHPHRAHRVEADRMLAEIDQLLVRMFALVSEGLGAASEALFTGDRDLARQVIVADRRIDELQLEIEQLVEEHLAHGSLNEPEQVRLLVSMLRIAPELERSGDLIEHIALRTPQRLLDRVTPRARGLLAEMADTAHGSWVIAADAYVERDARRTAELRDRDDFLDDRHVEFTAELPRGGGSIADAIELGLIARFYERLGDHAVNITRRISYLTGA